MILVSADNSQADETPLTIDEAISELCDVLKDRSGSKRKPFHDTWMESTADEAAALVALVICLAWFVASLTLCVMFSWRGGNLPLYPPCGCLVSLVFMVCCAKHLPRTHGYRRAQKELLGEDIDRVLKYLEEKGLKRKHSLKIFLDATRSRIYQGQSSLNQAKAVVHSICASATVGFIAAAIAALIAIIEGQKASYFTVMAYFYMAGIVILAWVLIILMIKAIREPSKFDPLQRLEDVLFFTCLKRRPITVVNEVEGQEPSEKEPTDNSEDKSGERDSKNESERKLPFVVMAIAFLVAELGCIIILLLCPPNQALIPCFALLLASFIFFSAGGICAYCHHKNAMDNLSQGQNTGESCSPISVAVCMNLVFLAELLLAVFL